MAEDVGFVTMAGEKATGNALHTQLKIQSKE